MKTQKAVYKVQVGMNVGEGREMAYRILGMFNTTKDAKQVELALNSHEELISHLRNLAQMFDEEGTQEGKLLAKKTYALIDKAGGK